METSQDPRSHLRHLIAGFDTAMLVTQGEGLHARPMAVAHAGLASEDERDEHLYFATSIDSGKVQELEREHDVALTFQDARRYVALSGRATVRRDRALVERLWSEGWRVWFPAGKDDPDLCIVDVRPERAEYWDMTGDKGVQAAWNALKAYVRSDKPEEVEDATAKVPFRR